ncbi:MAG: ATP-binding cassette domain-containing protein [Gammaproteobacteria bacterium]
MKTDIATLSWPESRLGEGMEELARRAGLHPANLDAAIAPAGIAQNQSELSRWMEWASERLCLEAEAVESPLTELRKLLTLAGPCVFHQASDGGSRFWLIVKSNSNQLKLLAPDLRIHRCELETLRAELCYAREKPYAAEIDALLDAAEISGQRREKARMALLHDRLIEERLDGCWILRTPPSANFWRQLKQADLPQRLSMVLLVFSLVYGLEIAGWRVIGQGALDGRVDLGWFWLWALLVLSLIPLQLSGHWLESIFALDIGRILKQRLLAGALKMDLETIRQQGAGQLLGRVIESQALESLALNGGLSVLIAGVELLFAAWVILLGAGGALQLALLIFCLAVTLGSAWHYFQRLRRLSLTRLDMTHELVERMVGHRTCLAQEDPTLREAQQDHAIETYLGHAIALDRSLLPLAITPRVWLIIGLIGIMPAFVTGNASAVALAVGLGGLLLAARALSGITGGFSALARAIIAWEQVAPLFHAAARNQDSTPFLKPTQLKPSSPDRAVPALIDARKLAFRYRPQGEPVLHQIDLTIGRGERILLSGDSGGGKSTLASLISGLRQPESGLLLLNGLDRHTLGDAWHQLACAAPQFHENHIFTGTLAFNLLMGRRWPASTLDLREAHALCLELGLGELLERMPAGLMQMVGETGWQLSHGERSRVFLARALLQNAELTILDESFAALDPETLEKCLSCALARASTLMVIAHP